MTLKKNVLAILIVLLLFSIGASHAIDLADDEILVTTDDTSVDIQIKIDNAALNDTLVFDKGEYTLNLIVNKSVNLRGIETAHVVLNGDGINPIIEVNNSATVTIQNFHFKSAEIGIEITETSPITIKNNIFQLGATGTAVLIDTLSTNAVSITNNTFYNNKMLIDVVQAEQTVDAKNNIFANSVSAEDLFFNVFNGGVQFNCFDVIVDNYSSSFDNKYSLAIDFVDPENDDFHLLDQSACIDEGEGFEDVDDTVTDTGAYGGADADQLAFPISGVTVEHLVAGSATVSWEENLDYRLNDYKIYYSTESLQELNDAAERVVLKQIPVAAGLTSATISDLDISIDPPDAPVLSSVVPRDNTLIVSWQSVNNANNYTLYYQLQGGSIQSVDNLGNVNSYELTGLANGSTYTVWLTALREYKYFVQVVGTIENDGVVAEGLFINADTEFTRESEDKESDISNALTGIPEAIQPYPALPNEGCFIATAAFGFYSHEQVQVLRNFRDNYLLTNDIGTGFVNWYYRYGPHAASIINENEILKPIVRVMLYPLIIMAEGLAYNVTVFYTLVLFYLLVLYLLIRFCFRFFYYARLKV